MPIETIITFDLSKFGLRIPERVFVKIQSKLTFRLKGIQDFFLIQQVYRPSVSIYFPETVPKGFESRYTKRLDSRENDLEIASSVINSLGDYKYGVSIQSDGKDIYDEDPFIIVYV